jgi:hypothetical protein
MANGGEFNLRQTAFRAGQWIRRVVAVVCLAGKILRFLQSSINFSIYKTNKVNCDNN